MKLSGVLGSRTNQHNIHGHDMFREFESAPNNMGEFFFKYDSDEDSIHLEGIEERLEEMMRSFDQGSNFNSEEFEREIEEILTPMLEELGMVEEEINISISIESITAQDLESVNSNATDELRVEDDLEFEFVNFFPNPNNGEFTLRFKLPTDDEFKVIIFNQVGKTVYEEIRVGESDYNNNIDLNSLANGPYFLQILQGERTYSRKIIKE